MQAKDKEYTEQINSLYSKIKQMLEDREIVLKRKREEEALAV